MAGRPSVFRRITDTAGGSSIFRQEPPSGDSVIDPNILFDDAPGDFDDMPGSFDTPGQS
jgi:hypothetical protein